MTAIRVWCRSGALRSPPRSSANRSSRRRSMSSTDITRTLAAASSIASGSPSSRRTTRRTASSSSGTPGRAAEARWQNRSAAASSASWPSAKTRSAAIASGARVVVTTRSCAARGDQERDQVGDRLDDVLAVVEDQQRRRLVEQLRDPGADVVALLGGEHPPAAHRVADARARSRPRRPRPRATATPTSSTKWTTGCSASRPSRCASRVLPSPPGPEDRGDPRLADRGAQGPDVLVAADQRGGLEAQPLAHRTVGGQQLAVHRLQRRARGRPRAGRPARRGAARSGPGRRARRAPRPSSAAARPPRPRRRRPASTSRASASSWSPSADSARPSTAVAIARCRAAAARSSPSGPSAALPGCRERQGRAGQVAGPDQVVPALGLARAHHGVPQRQRVDRVGPQAEPVAVVGPRHHLGRGLRRGPGRPRPGAPWPGWPARRRAPRPRRPAAPRETWPPAATRAASSAWVRPPGSGVPCQDTSSSSRRSGHVGQSGHLLVGEPQRPAATFSSRWATLPVPGIDQDVLAEGEGPGQPDLGRAWRPSSSATASDRVRGSRGRGAALADRRRHDA